MAVRIEFDAVFVDGKRFVHACQVLPPELYKCSVGWRILELGQADKLAPPLPQTTTRTASWSCTWSTSCLRAWALCVAAVM